MLLASVLVSMHQPKEITKKRSFSEAPKEVKSVYFKLTQNHIFIMSYFVKFLQMKIMQTHVLSPTSFWGQVMDSNKANEVYELSEKLQALCPIANSFSTVPPMNKVNCM